MITTQKEAIILLYPSKTQITKELRISLSDFCKAHNMSIVDIISPTDEYDYFGMRRLIQIIKYRNKPISLITNKSFLAIVPPLIFWSVLEVINSTKPIELTRDFLHALKESANKSERQTSEDFHILNHGEVERISDWLSDIHYAIMRGQ